MHNIKLKALRQGVGLTVAEASELLNVNKRSFQYWESDPSRAIPDDCLELFDKLAFSVRLIIDLMQEDVEIYNEKHGLLVTDDDVQSKIVLPFFSDFDKFKAETGCPLVQFWRVYQAAISHLLLRGHITHVDDDAKIPDYFIVNSWLAGYTHHHTEKWEFDRERGEWY